jgi:uncharacterized protein (TIGR00299 family) protein
MHLGAMIDLGVPGEYLVEALAKLGLDGYKVSIKRAQRKGIEGIMVDVIVAKEQLSSYARGGTHNYASGRKFSDIKNLINNSPLSPSIKEMSVSIFERIAIAEGKIHGLPVEKVHFHEVGAIDSIIDIVGAAVCIDYLKPDLILASPPELGSGMVKCQHGLFPVPAPATSEILTGIPVRTGGVNHEATTPTGAAILAEIVEEFTSKTEFRILKTAYGIGFRDTDQVPNVLRIFLAEQDSSSALEKAVMIECNIDDMNPEHYDYIITKLFESGADDVFLAPIIMKKSRPGITLSVLAKPAEVSTIISFILEETTSIGLRQYYVDKTVLERKIFNLETPWGPVQVKEAMIKDRGVKTKAEYEDCKKIARENNIPLRQVMEQIDQLIWQHNSSKSSGKNIDL